MSKSKSKLRLKGIGLGLILLTSVLATSCSSDSDDSQPPPKSSCATAKSACANDRAPTSEEIDTCEKGLSDAKCAGVFAAALICLANHQVCAADGTTDQDKTKAQCKAELDTSAACFDGDAGAKH